jgi:hypothetical protein
MKTPLTVMRHHPVLLALLIAAPSTSAFPPAPHYTLYGMVRDQVGQTLVAEGASLILLKGSVELARTPISRSLGIDQNYELKIRIDANRPSTKTYNPAAIAANSPFSLAVEMNGLSYYPIEVDGELTAGSGGERVRLDLNLGVDSDGDGLPDTWEEWQLYQAGYLPDENGWDLSLIDRDGDFDGDGRSNWLEYVAGTFAGDRSDYFKMEIREKTQAYVRFEFYAITGKTYTLERSTDFVTWMPAHFSLTESGERFAAQSADAVGIRSAWCDPAIGASKEFYRMIVR